MMKNPKIIEPAESDLFEPNPLSTPRLSQIAQFHEDLTGTLEKYIVGNSHLLELIILAMLSEGHILIEGYPGTAKTTIAKAVALATNCFFDRIQGAVDLQPADMTGVRIFDQATKEFVLRPGPIFTNILLADEINRINPKSQSAFIEAMSEQQATIDGETRRITSPFLVIATQNPYELQGTFPLIEAQRDRFMFGLRSKHLGSDDELDLLRRASFGRLNWDQFAKSVALDIGPQTILEMIQSVHSVHIEDAVLTYIRDIVVATRENGNISLGASSRASIAFVRSTRAKAAVAQRAYVLPDDVKSLAHEVLGHRIILTHEAEVEGLLPGDVIREILESIEVP